MEEIVDNSKDEIEVLTEGAIRILEVENEIKGLKNDIKAIKNDVKEQGGNVSNLNKALTIIKNNAKRRLKPEIKDIEIIAEQLEANDELNRLVFGLFEDK